MYASGSTDINEIGVAHWCTLCTLSRSMGMVYTVCTAGLHAPQIYVLSAFRLSGNA